MYCANCGSVLTGDNAFCPHCGSTVTTQNTAVRTARYETITVTLDNKDLYGYFWNYYLGHINDLIKDYEKFGWEVHGTQSVKTRDSHLERHGDTIYSVTESENESVITFKRNKNMPHYDELNTLFYQYQEFLDSYPHGLPADSKNGLLFIFLILCAWPFAIVYYFYCEKKNQKANEEYQKIKDTCDSGIQQILNAAEKLL